MVRNWRTLLVDTLTIGTVIIYPTRQALAQNITTDGTVGTPQILRGPNYNIPQSLGQKVNNNLFHSFGKFNLDSNEAAIFQSGNEINNIFSRVTGGSPSSINGLIRTLGQNVNLFFLNPSGIIFGENASLDVSGSFLATTADSFVFGDGLEFSATNPQATPLLTVNFSPGLQYGQNNPIGTIINKGNLTVNPGQTLALIGGDVTLDGAEIISPGSNVILGGLNQGGTVNINENLSSSLPQGIKRGNVSLINLTVLDVASNEEGSININAQNLEISDSQVWAGIREGLGFENAQSGHIRIDVSEKLEIKNSFIFNDVGIDARGNSGSILINAEDVEINNSSINTDILGRGDSGGVVIDTSTLSLTNGGQIASSTFGEGDAGAVQITASDGITIDESRIRNGVAPNAVGNSGEIVINTSTLSLTNGGQILELNFGEGDAGAVQVTASDGIIIDGENSNGVASGIYSQLGINAVGNSGEIVIDTSTLSLTNGGQIASGTFGEGDAGAVQVTASDGITIDGEDSNGLASAILSEVISNALGNSGGIVIDTSTLSLTNGGIISSSTLGEGDAGAVQVTASDGITIDGEDSNGLASAILSVVESDAVGNSGGIVVNTSTLSLTNGGEIGASSFGRGNAGRVQITASDGITIDGEKSNGLPGGIVTGIANNAVGNTGEILIQTSTLSLANGGRILASTSGKGDAGIVQVTASDGITINAEKTDRFPSGIFSTVNRDAVGNSRGIVVNTSTLSLTNGGIISASSLGEGDAGVVRVTASDSVSLAGTSFDQNSNRETGGILAFTTNKGKAGDILIDTQQFLISNGAEVAAFTEGEGKAGSIIVNAPQQVNIDANSSLIVETSAEGKPGDINITTNTLTIGENARLSATATETATNLQGGGSINLNSQNLNISGTLGIFAETQGTTPAGNLTISPNDEKTNLNIQFTDNGFISARTTDIGQGGNITITAPETIDIQGNGSITVETLGRGQAGDINITSQNFNLSNQTKISASTFNSGQAGNINITANNFNLKEDAAVITNTTGSVQAGDIQLQIRDNLNLVNSKITASTAENSSGKGGNINIETQNITIQDGATIAVNSDGSGQGGNITLAAEELTLDNGSITAETASNQGGNISLDIGNILGFDNSGEITATAGNNQNPGDGGNVTINADFILAFPTDNTYEITANAFQGDGGNIEITTNSFFGREFVNITASSEFGLEGDVSIDILEIDPTKGLTELPANVIDASQKITQGCTPQESGRFVATGRGGLPLSPNEPLRGTTVITNWVDEPTETTGKVNNQLAQTLAENKSNSKIIEAQGWIINAQGNLELVTETAANPSLPINVPCNKSR